jgi:hypothetical protein
MSNRLVQKVLVSPRFENFLILGPKIFDFEKLVFHFTPGNPDFMVPLESWKFSKQLSNSVLLKAVYLQSFRDQYIIYEYSSYLCEITKGGPLCFFNFQSAYSASSPTLRPRELGRLPAN